MRIMTLVFAILCIGWTKAAEPASEKELDAYLVQVFPANQPGAAVMIKMGDKVLLHKGYGLANMEHAIPVKPDTIFEIGSVTKQFTAGAIMLLAQEGKLSVNDEISRYLPHFPTQGRKITIHHLLNHTSGLINYTDIPSFFEDAGKKLSVHQLISVFQDEPLLFEPGARWAYCNSGYALLGAIIETINRKPYGEFIEERILAPLGMKHSSYGDTRKIIPGRATGYQWDGDQGGHADYHDFSQPYAAGALLSTVGDLMRWSDALKAGSFLKKEQVEAMTTNHLLVGGSPSGYGYGLMIRNVRGFTSIEHGGDIMGFAAELISIPEKDLTVALLTNREGNLGHDVARRVTAMVLGDPYRQRKAQPISDQDLAAHEGYFALNGNPILVSVENGKLSLGSFMTDLVYGGDGIFFGESSLSFLKFEKKSGEVTGAELHLRDGILVLEMPRVEQSESPTAAGLKREHLKSLTGTYALESGPDAVISVEGAVLTLRLGSREYPLESESELEYFTLDHSLDVIFERKGGEITGLAITRKGRKIK